MSYHTAQNKWKNIQENHDLNQDNHILLDPLDIFYIGEIKNVRKTMPWIIFSLGMLGNFLILLVFMAKKRRSSSNGFCFNALAISDIFALIFMLLGSLLTLRIVGNKAAACKIIRYCYHVSLQLSSWCLVLLTVDRLIAVCFIFQYNTWSKKWYPQKILAILVLVIVLLNLHLLIFIDAGIYEVTKTESLKKSYWEVLTPATPTQIHQQVYSCYVDTDDHPFYFKYIYSYWDIFHAIIYGISPFIIILACNLMIIVKLAKMGKQKLKRASSINAMKPENYESSKSRQVTIMLLSIAFAFLIFTSPISIYMATIFDNITSVRKTKRELIKNVLRYIAYFNNALNFYIYVALSSEFRREFLKKFGRCCRAKELASCTRSTELAADYKKEHGMAYTANKPIVRRPLKFKMYDDSSEAPFLNGTDSTRTNGSNDSVERFKKGTRKSTLVHYNKDPSRWSNFLEEEARIKETEANDQEDFVDLDSSRDYSDDFKVAYQEDLMYEYIGGIQNNNEEYDQENPPLNEQEDYSPTDFGYSLTNNQKNNHKNLDNGRNVLRNDRNYSNKCDQKDLPLRYNKGKLPKIHEQYEQENHQENMPRNYYDLSSYNEQKRLPYINDQENFSTLKTNTYPENLYSKVANRKIFIDNYATDV